MRCPRCHEGGCRVIRTRRRKRDGAVVRDRVCRRCGHAWADAERMRPPVRGQALAFRRGRPAS